MRNKKGKKILLGMLSTPVSESCSLFSQFSNASGDGRGNFKSGFIPYFPNLVMMSEFQNRRTRAKKTYYPIPVCFADS